MIDSSVPKDNKVDEVKLNFSKKRKLKSFDYNTIITRNKNAEKISLDSKTTRGMIFLLKNGIKPYTYHNKSVSCNFLLKSIKNKQKSLLNKTF